jgi:hypothetical protein
MPDVIGPRPTNAKEFLIFGEPSRLRYACFSITRSSYRVNASIARLCTEDEMTLDPKLSRWILLALLAVPLTMIGCDDDAKSLAKKFFSAWAKVEDDSDRMRFDSGRKALQVDEDELGTFVAGTPGSAKDAGPPGSTKDKLTIGGVDYTSTATTDDKDNGVIDDGEVFESADGVQLILDDDGWGMRTEPGEDDQTLFWTQSGSSIYIEWGLGGKADSDGERLTIRFDLHETQDYTLDGAGTLTIDGDDFIAQGNNPNSLKGGSPWIHEEGGFSATAGTYEPRVDSSNTFMVLDFGDSTAVVDWFISNGTLDDWYFGRRELHTYEATDTEFISGEIMHFVTDFETDDLVWLAYREIGSFTRVIAPSMLAGYTPNTTLPPEYRLFHNGYYESMTGGVPGVWTRGYSTLEFFSNGTFTVTDMEEDPPEIVEEGAWQKDGEKIFMNEWEAWERTHIMWPLAIR